MIQKPDTTPQEQWDRLTPTQQQHVADHEWLMAELRKQHGEDELAWLQPTLH